jgi:putative selenate reductase molybdopterin-binding subunit
MAAEVLGVHTDDIIVYSSDTDFTPFDKGAYASSTTFVSGAAVTKAAAVAAEQIKTRAAKMLTTRNSNGVYSSDNILLKDQKATAPDGNSITLAEIALDTLHHNDQMQIIGTGSHVSPSSPPPFAAQFAEVTVDTQTGAVVVDKLVMVVDSGQIMNPQTASGQIEGGMIQALGYAVCEEMTYDKKGVALERDFLDYHIFSSTEIPQLTTIFVETNEPSHPFGAKAVAEIPMDGVAPAVGNAILNAIGINIDTLPITPEKVWAEINKTK